MMTENAVSATAVVSDAINTAISNASQPAPKPTGGEAWTISFSNATKRKISKKEQVALQRNNCALGSGAVTPTTTEDDADRNQPAQSSSTVNINDIPLDPELVTPRGLKTTQQDMLQRIHMDVPRLLCIAKQYPRSCGVTSLTSVWNSLYSCIGHGVLPPVSQEEVMSILGFQPPYDTIRWGPFTGNTTLLRWFHCINRHFGVQGKAYYLWKVHGQGRTPAVSAEDAEVRLQEALRNPKAAVIYHCHNHYMVPIGFQAIPKNVAECYKKEVQPQDTELTVFIGEVSRGKHPAMYSVKWKDIVTDLSTTYPNYFNIRHAELGIQKRQGRKKSDAPEESAEADLVSPAVVDTTALAAPVTTTTTTASPVTSCSPTSSSTKGPSNLHCLLIFRCDMVEEDLSQFERTEGGAMEIDEENDPAEDAPLATTGGTKGNTADEVSSDDDAV